MKGIDKLKKYHRDFEMSQYSFCKLEDFCAESGTKNYINLHEILYYTDSLFVVNDLVDIDKVICTNAFYPRRFIKEYAR